MSPKNNINTNTNTNTNRTYYNQNSSRKSINFYVNGSTLFQKNFNDTADSHVLNSSLCLSEIRDQEVGSKSTILTDRSFIASQADDVDIKKTKIKMGIQLSILEKSILRSNKNNKDRPKRLNRSGLLRKSEQH